MKRPRATSVREVVTHSNIENAVPSVSDMPNKDKAKITARFHGPNPPLLGISILMELNTNDINAGNSPRTMPFSVISSRVNGNAKKARYVSM